MKNLPSKELLNEVLPFGDINSLISYGLSSDGDILLQYEDIDEIFNIYELAHKCKEWALTNKYKIVIYSDDSFDWYCQVQLADVDEQPKEWSVAQTEPESIFRACEWILENKDRK